MSARSQLRAVEDSWALVGQYAVLELGTPGERALCNRLRLQTRNWSRADADPAPEAVDHSSRPSGLPDGT